MVELLLNHNSDKEHRNKAGCTPLMLAARYSAVNIVLYYIKYSALFKK